MERRAHPTKRADRRGQQHARTVGPAAVVERALPPQPVRDAGPDGARFSRRRAVVLVLAGVAGGASLVLLLPALADLPDTWERLTSGDGRWLLLALGFEAISFLGHIVLFRAVSVDAGSRVGMRASTEITLAGHVATRLFASGGAGGVALTAWALHRSGMDRREVAARMTTFIVLLYSVYMFALIGGGLGLFLGLLPGDAPVALTLVPAALGVAVVSIVLSMPYVARRLERLGARHERVGKAGPAAAALGDGVRDSLRMARRLDPGLLGALLWWAGDIAVLWAAFNAFGEAPAVAVIVIAYFVGMLANTLPLPGGVGGVDGGMIGALIAFGVDPGLAVVAVLAYRGFAFWLPIAPGALAWVSLRRTVATWDRENAAAAAAEAPAGTTALTVVPARPALAPAPAHTTTAKGPRREPAPGLEAVPAGCAACAA
jgi:uncharacterized membrane protein YbhN (UPF0104 family)